MKKAIDVTAVTHAIGAVRAIKDELRGKLDALDYNDREQFKFARAAAERQLEDYGARIALCGISSSSTSGIGSAMGNWLRAAQAKIGGAA